MNKDIREQVREKYAQAISTPAAENLLPELVEEERNEWNGAIVSAFIRGKKPSQKLVSGKDFNITLAEQGDFLQLHEILIKNGLPIAGVDFGKGNYYIASGQELMGIIGVEQYGRAVMLRSLAIKPQFRKMGIAKELIDYALQQLKDRDVTDIYLITNTAQLYMTKYGFVRIERDEIPNTVLTVSTLGDVCPLSSICMHLQL